MFSLKDAFSSLIHKFSLRHPSIFYYNFTSEMLLSFISFPSEMLLSPLIPKSLPNFSFRDASIFYNFCCIFQQVTITFVGEGPVVHLDPLKMDWGVVPVLKDMPRVLVLSNESLIPARFETKLVGCSLLSSMGARCSSVVRAFAHGAMGRRIDPLWGWTH